MKKLNNLSLPTSEVTSHKQALRYALLRSYEDHQKKTSWLKGGEIIMKHKALSIGLSGMLLIAVAFGFFLTGNQTLTPQAEAKEAVEKAFTKFKQLSPEAQAELEEKIKADMETSLQEAKDAKDLEIIPEEELIRFTPPENGEDRPLFYRQAKKVKHFEEEEKPDAIIEGEAGVVIGTDPKQAVPGTHLMDEGKITVPEGLKILRYTDPKGRKTILGINDQDEAVMKMIQLSDQDLKNMQSVTPENAEDFGFSISESELPQ